MLPRTRPLLALLFACALLSMGGAPEVRPGGARAVGPTGIVLPAADPMATEMGRELDRAQRAYAELFGRLSLARSEAEAFGIQEDMRQQRTELQITLLRIQAAYARRAGRNAFAAQLERAIEALIASDPKPAGPDRRRQL